MPKYFAQSIGRVAQWIRRPTSNRKIVGSIPIVVSFLDLCDASWMNAVAATSNRRS